MAASQLLKPLTVTDAIGVMDGVDSSETHLHDTEIFKIKLSFSSLTNSVVVCPVVATLYSWKPSDTETWNYFKIGVPVLVIVHDSQDHSKNVQMQLCIVDRQNGFATWRENITERSEYKMTQRNFHTLKLNNPREEGEMVGLKFPNDEIASVFYKDVHCNIPDETEQETKESPKHIEKKRSVKGKDNSKSLRKLCKEDISSPCMFTHVTSINNSTFSGDKEKASASPAHGNGRSKSGFVRKTLSFSTKKR